MVKLSNVVVIGAVIGAGVLLYTQKDNIVKFFEGLNPLKPASDAFDFVTDTFNPSNVGGNIGAGADIYAKMFAEWVKNNQTQQVTNYYTTYTQPSAKGTIIVPDALSNPATVSNAPAQVATARQTFSANPPTAQQTVAVSLGLPTSFINPNVNTGTSNPIKVNNSSSVGAVYSGVNQNSSKAPTPQAVIKPASNPIKIVASSGSGTVKTAVKGVYL